MHTCMHTHMHACTHTHTGPAHNSKTTQSYYSKKCIWTGRVIRGVRHNPVVYVPGYLSTFTQKWEWDVDPW